MTLASKRSEWRRSRSRCPDASEPGSTPRHGVESRAGAPVVGSGGGSVAFATGLSPAPVTAFPVPRSPNPACGFPAPGSPVGSCPSHTGDKCARQQGKGGHMGVTAESCTAPDLAAAVIPPAVKPVDALTDQIPTPAKLLPFGNRPSLQHVTLSDSPAEKSGGIGQATPEARHLSTSLST